MGGFFGGGGESPAVPVTTPTKAPTMADSTVSAAASNTRRRYAMSGNQMNILTSGQGDTSTPTTSKKELLGQ